MDIERETELAFAGCQGISELDRFRAATARRTLENLARAHRRVAVCGSTDRLVIEVHGEEA